MRFCAKFRRLSKMRKLRKSANRHVFKKNRKSVFWTPPNMVSSYNFVRFLLISLILAHLPLYRGFISGEPLTIRKFNYRNLRRQRNLFKFQNFAQKRSHNFVRFSLILQILAHLPIYSSLISCESLKIRKFNHWNLRCVRILLKLQNSAQKRNLVGSYNFVRFLLISQILAHLPICSSLILGEPWKIHEFNY